jgi:hypothetical protein
MLLPECKEEAINPANNQLDKQIYSHLARRRIKAATV